MNEGLDLTEAVAAFKAAWEAANTPGNAGHRTEAGITAAAPLIEAAVREQVAREIEADAELYDRSGEWRDGMDESAFIARGKP